jgi:hypothetical protein
MQYFVSIARSFCLRAQYYLIFFRVFSDNDKERSTVYVSTKSQHPMTAHNNFSFSSTIQRSSPVCDIWTLSSTEKSWVMKCIKMCCETLEKVLRWPHLNSTASLGQLLLYSSKRSASKSQYSNILWASPSSASAYPKDHSLLNLKNAVMDGWLIFPLKVSPLYSTQLKELGHEINIFWKPWT